MDINDSIHSIVEELISATYGTDISAREKHVFREALLGLVRLAKAEQMYEVRNDINKLLSVPKHDLHSYWEVD